MPHRMNGEHLNSINVSLQHNFLWILDFFIYKPLACLYLHSACPPTIFYSGFRTASPPFGAVGVREYYRVASTKFRMECQLANGMTPRSSFSYSKFSLILMSGGGATFCSWLLIDHWLEASIFSFRGYTYESPSFFDCESWLNEVCLYLCGLRDLRNKLYKPGLSKWIKIEATYETGAILELFRCKNWYEPITHSKSCGSCMYTRDHWVLIEASS